MALTFIATESKKDLTPRITVFGVGGAGGNAVNNMIEQQLEGVDFVVANTDAQALQQSKAPTRIQLGVQATEGLGAGARPEVGANAAAETLEEIMDHLSGAHMCFITAGMGGGTGTGAAPIIAQAAREMGILTVGVVTKPFAFEGAKRMRQAEQGVEDLQKVVDTLIIIPNQNLFRLANERTTFTEAFALADDVLYQGVKGVTDLMVRPGMINLDFADVRAVMDEMGKAMMGTGEAAGEDRARQAAEKAIANPLLDEISLNGAKGVLINITGGPDMTLFELDEAANLIREKVDPEANIIVGSTLDPEMQGMIRVSVVATGIEAQPHVAEVPRRRLGEPLVHEPAHVEPQPEPVAMHDEPTYEPAYAAYEEPRYEPRPEPRAEPRYEHRAETRQEQPRMEQPRVEPRPEPLRPAAPEQRYAEPRSEGRLEARGEVRADPRAETRQPMQQSWHEAPRQSERMAERQPERQHDRMAEPVQEDFFLEDALIDTPRRAPVAPRPAQADLPLPPKRGRAPGEPTPEALQRLNSLIGRNPEQRRPVAPPAPQPAAAPAAHHGEGRLSRGLGSLIVRMTGGGEHAPKHEPQPVRHAPPVQHGGQHGYDDDPSHRGSDSIEIPAFLRRQAN